MASFLAAGTAYAEHGVPSIPFYIFYSMFGSQRVGDLVWPAATCWRAASCSAARPGARRSTARACSTRTATRRCSPPPCRNLKVYDPAWGWELATIVEDGIERMYRRGEAVFYYLTVYNEAHLMPGAPADPAAPKACCAACTGCANRRAGAGPVRVNLFGSGSLLPQALAAAELLRARFAPRSGARPATSSCSARRSPARWNRLHRTKPRASATSSACSPACPACSSRSATIRSRSPSALRRGCRALRGARHRRLRAVGGARAAARALRRQPRAHRLGGAARAGGRGELDATRLATARHELGIDAGQPDPAASEPGRRRSRRHQRGGRFTPRSPGAAGSRAARRRGRAAAARPAATGFGVSHGSRAARHRGRHQPSSARGRTPAAAGCRAHRRAFTGEPWPWAG